MLRSMAMRATLVGMGANFALLALKGIATGLSDSLTIFSETMNSLSDLVAAFAILLCVRWAWQTPDAGHPFGHRRAEPIAGLLVAIFTGILGFEVCRRAVLDLWSASLPESIGPYPIVALCITAVGKSGMAWYFKRRARQLHSPAFRAAAVDCRNDVLIASQGLVAVILAHYEILVLDTIGALLVGGYILYSAYGVGMENIDYLMGKAPEPELLQEVRSSAEHVPGVLAVDEIKGHYVGTFIHVELTVDVDGAISTTSSHTLAEAVRDAVEKLDVVDRAFVHIEPAV